METQSDARGGQIETRGHKPQGLTDSGHRESLTQSLCVCSGRREDQCTMGEGSRSRPPLRPSSPESSLVPQFTVCTVGLGIRESRPLRVTLLFESPTPPSDPRLPLGLVVAPPPFVRSASRRPRFRTSLLSPRTRRDPRPYR